VASLEQPIVHNPTIFLASIQGVILVDELVNAPWYPSVIGLGHSQGLLTASCEASLADWEGYQPPVPATQASGRMIASAKLRNSLRVVRMLYFQGLQELAMTGMVDRTLFGTSGKLAVSSLQLPDMVFDHNNFRESARILPISFSAHSTCRSAACYRLRSSELLLTKPTGTNPALTMNPMPLLTAFQMIMPIDFPSTVVSHVTWTRPTHVVDFGPGKKSQVHGLLIACGVPHVRVNLTTESEPITSSDALAIESVPETARMFDRYMTIIQRFSDVGENITPESSIWSIGVTSEKMVSLTQELAAAAGVFLPSTLVFDYPIVRDLIAYILNATGQSEETIVAPTEMMPTTQVEQKGVRKVKMSRLIRRRKFSHLDYNVYARPLPSRKLTTHDRVIQRPARRSALSADIQPVTFQTDIASLSASLPPDVTSFNASMSTVACAGANLSTAYVAHLTKPVSKNCIQHRDGPSSLPSYDAIWNAYAASKTLSSGNSSMHALQDRIRPPARGARLSNPLQAATHVARMLGSRRVSAYGVTTQFVASSSLMQTSLIRAAVATSKLISANSKQSMSFMTATSMVPQVSTPHSVQSFIQPSDVEEIRRQASCPPRQISTHHSATVAGFNKNSARLLPCSLHTMLDSLLPVGRQQLGSDLAQYIPQYLKKERSHRTPQHLSPRLAKISTDALSTGATMQFSNSICTPALGITRYGQMQSLPSSCTPALDITRFRRARAPLKTYTAHSPELQWQLLQKSAQRLEPVVPYCERNVPPLLDQTQQQIARRMRQSMSSRLTPKAAEASSISSGTPGVPDNRFRRAVSQFEADVAAFMPTASVIRSREGYVIAATERISRPSITTVARRGRDDLVPTLSEHVSSLTKLHGMDYTACLNSLLAPSARLTNSYPLSFSPSLPSSRLSPSLAVKQMLQDAEASRRKDEDSRRIISSDATHELSEHISSLAALHGMDYIASIRQSPVPSDRFISSYRLSSAPIPSLHPDLSFRERLKPSGPTYFVPARKLQTRRSRKFMPSGLTPSLRDQLAYSSTSSKYFSPLVPKCIKSIPPRKHFYPQAMQTHELHDSFDSDSALMASGLHTTRNSSDLPRKILRQLDRIQAHALSSAQQAAALAGTVYNQLYAIVPAQQPAAARRITPADFVHPCFQQASSLMEDATLFHAGCMHASSLLRPPQGRKLQPVPCSTATVQQISQGPFFPPSHESLGHFQNLLASYTLVRPVETVLQLEDGASSVTPILSAISRAVSEMALLETDEVDFRASLSQASDTLRAGVQMPPMPPPWQRTVPCQPEVFIRAARPRSGTTVPAILPLSMSSPNAAAAALVRRACLSPAAAARRHRPRPTVAAAPPAPEVSEAQEIARRRMHEEMRRYIRRVAAERRTERLWEQARREAAGDAAALAEEPTEAEPTEREEAEDLDAEGGPDDEEVRLQESRLAAVEEQLARAAEAQRLAEEARREAEQREAEARRRAELDAEELREARRQLAALRARLQGQPEAGGQAGADPVSASQGASSSSATDEPDQA